MESLIYTNSIPFKLHGNSRLASPWKLAPPPESRWFRPLSATLHPSHLVSTEPIDESAEIISAGTGNVVEDKRRFLTLLRNYLSAGRCLELGKCY